MNTWVIGNKINMEYV